MVGVAELLFVAQGLRLANRMLTWPDESAYVHLGYLATTGQVSLFQDDFLGSRVPLPFYVIGLSQVIWGRNLLAARLVSLVLSLGALLFVALLARGLAGDSAGGLAALFFASQGVIVGYFVTATYHALGGCLLLAGLVLMVSVPPPRGPLIGMAVVSLLFLTRANMWPALPAVLAVLLWEARGARERVLLLAAAAVVPLAFLLGNPGHERILAYVPIVQRWLAPADYVSTLALTDIPDRSSYDRVWALVRVGRMYEFWWLAAALLGGLLIARRMSGRDLRPFLRGRWVWLVAALVGYLFLWQVVLFWQFPKTLAAYFPTFAPLVPVLLGVGFARILEDRKAPRWSRRTIAVAVLGLLLAPTVIVRHPLLPLSTDANPSPIQELNAAGAHMARLIPTGSKVFLWGDSLPLYLAGRTPYLRQIHSPQTLAVVQDVRAIQRNGLWGRAELEAWLGRDSDYAVIQVSLLDHYRDNPGMPVKAMEMLLATHFELVARVDDYRWFHFDVYRRLPTG